MWRWTMWMVLVAGTALPAAAMNGLAAPELRDGQRIRFEVRDAESGEKLFVGDERIEIRDGTVSKRTVYRTLDRGEVQVEKVSYELDSLRVNELVTEQPALGEQVRLRRDGETVQIEYRPGDGDPRFETLTWGPQMQVGKTLHHIIVRRWEELASGDPVTFDLLVPTRFTSYRFRLLERPPSAQGHRVFRLEPEAWLLRQLVAPMDFHYDESRRAVKYVGPTTVGRLDDTDRQVEIRFSY